MIKKTLRVPSSMKDFKSVLGNSKQIPWLIAGLFIVLTAVWLLWPVPRGRMPLSADHTVHLTRIWLWKKQLLMGHVRGWDPTWGFGFPIGELYPPLGDALTLLIYGLGLGILSISTSYAFAFTFIFCLQGLVFLRLAQVACRSQNLPAFLPALIGAIAAWLFLWDPGSYREGGWIYTVQYGVWPQALATSLVWLGFAEVSSDFDRPDHLASRVQPLVLFRSAWIFGAAILAHPMAIPMLLLAWPIFCLCQTQWTKGACLFSLIRAKLYYGISLTLGAGLSAWWLLPMLEHKAWMANYGWLYMPLSNMITGLFRGEWTHAMSSPMGFSAIIGVLMIAAVGNRFARFCAATSLVYWVFASQNVFWELRLDRWSDAFTHIQYQRFLIAAKPGLYLASSYVIAITWKTLQSSWILPHWARWTPFAPLLISLGLMQQACSHGIEQKVGEIQLERVPSRPQFETNYFELVEWLDNQSKQRAKPLHIAVRASRNSHWFMDLPALVDLRLYKMGFTPGDNFVHKPESSSPRVLEALGIDYVVSLRSGERSRPREVARFGNIRVEERPPSADNRGALPAIEGTSKTELSVISDRVSEGYKELELRTPSHASDPDQNVNIKFAIAGYPRWQMKHNDQPISWQESPVWGNASPIDPDERRQGTFRDGKAHGKDGSEPTLIRATVPSEGRIELYYQRWLAIDWIGFALFGFSLLVSAGMIWPRTATLFQRALLQAFRPNMMKITIAGLGILTICASILVCRRIQHHMDIEGASVLGQWSDATTKRKGRIKPGPMKFDMKIQPALVARPKANRPARVVFPDLVLPETLSGWVALDDDFVLQAPQASHKITISMQQADGSWRPVFSQSIRHRPGVTPFEFSIDQHEPGQHTIQVELETTAKKRIFAGFNLYWSPALEVEFDAKTSHH